MACDENIKFPEVHSVLVSIFLRACICSTSSFMAAKAMSLWKAKLTAREKQAPWAMLTCYASFWTLTRYTRLRHQAVEEVSNTMQSHEITLGSSIRALNRRGVVVWPWLGAIYPPMPLYHSPSSWQGRENITKGSRATIKTGWDYLPITVTGNTDLTWGN